MNNIIIVGSILMFVCVFIASLDYGHLMSESVNKHICMVRNMPKLSLLYIILDYDYAWYLHKVCTLIKCKATSFYYINENHLI